MSPMSAQLVSATASFDSKSASSAELLALSSGLSAKLLEIEETLVMRKRTEKVVEPVIEVRFMLTEGVRFQKQKMDDEMEEDDEDNEVDSDDDDSNRIYIGSLDEDMEIDFAEFGGVCEYEEFCRRGSAKVYLDDKEIGSFVFQLISRDPLGGCLSFWEVCDAQSADLDQIAGELFEEGGKLKGVLERECVSEESSSGGFMYIESFSIEEPALYDKDSIACAAIEKFCNSEVLHSIENVPVTLAMYIPEDQRGPSEYIQGKKKWIDSGFTVISTTTCEYLFKELY